MTRRIGKRFRAGQKVEHEGADTMTGPGIGRTTRPGQTARARRMPARCMPALGLSAGIAVALAVSAGTAAAQTSPGQVPLSSPIQRVAPPPPAAVQPKLAPAPLPPAALPSASYEVTAVSVTGATAYREADLLALAGNLVGPHTNLRDIEKARRAILLKYRDDGYPFVVVAARVDKGGLLRFLVTEGYFADIKLSGDAGPVGTLVLKFLDHLKDQRPVNNASIEHWLLLAQSIPGLQVQPIVQPSEREPGAFTLIAKLTHHIYSGSLAVDNRSSPQTGAGEALLTLGVNSLTSFGERSEVALYLAGPSGREVFGQAGEQFFVGSSGLQVRLYGGAGDTLPCCALQQIGYDGKTIVFGTQVSYPLLLSRAQQLYVRALFDALDAEALEEGSRANGDSLRILRAQADYSLADTWLGDTRAGSTAVTVRLSQGLPLLGASANGRTDAGRLNEDMRFSKIDGEISRDQTVATFEGGERLSVFGLAAGQATRNILPSAEEFYLGGMRYTRGFYSGEASGDRGLAATLELRLTTELTEQVFGHSIALTPQFYAFYDWGESWANQSTDAGHRLRSFGAGLRTGITQNVRLEVEAVRRITRLVGGAGTTPDAATAFYSRIVTQF